MWRKKFLALAHHSRIWACRKPFYKQLGKLPKGENGSGIRTTLSPSLSLIPATEEGTTGSSRCQTRAGPLETGDCLPFPFIKMIFTVFLKYFCYTVISSTGF